jgi:penicillin-binding protein 1A
MNFFKFILKIGFSLSIGLLLIGGIFLIYYLYDLPSLADLEAESGTQVVEINYANGERITNRGEIYSNKINYYQVPQNLINAVVATEDRRFFSHIGVDIFGIIRAFAVNREAGRIVQGGSTITQQLAKLLFLDPQKTFKRKIQEVLLAVQLERNFTKEQILTFYLNRAYFGSGNYGVENAAKNYFGKTVSNLNLNECALLAGVLKAPSKLSPKNNKELAQQRAKVVLKAMVEMGFLNEENFAEIDQGANYKNDRSQKLYFSDFVFEQFREFLDKKDAKEKTIKITSTMDESLQGRLENILDKFINNNSKKLAKAEIAVIVMKKDGAILGLVGGNDYQKSQFNRAIYAKRQAGSAFKTFVYLAAFEKGFKVDDVFEDKKVNVGAWLPDNYEGKYLGAVTLENAFANSLNSVAVQLARSVGGEAIANMAHKLGIISAINKRDLTIALGTSELNLLELTAAYATIANNGRPVIPYAITEIKDSINEAIYSRQSSGFDAVVSDGALQKIKQVLRQAVASGTGKNANVANNIYGKTGTSQNFRDAWFVGFDDEYVVGVWIGNDDNSPSNKITGGSLPAILFGEILGGV